MTRHRSTASPRHTSRSSSPKAPGPFCSVLPSSAPYSVIAPHRDTTKIAFFDAHAARFAGQYVGNGVGDPKRGDLQSRVPGSTWNGPPQ